MQIVYLISVFLFVYIEIFHLQYSVKWFQFALSDLLSCPPFGTGQGPWDPPWEGVCGQQLYIWWPWSHSDPCSSNVIGSKLVILVYCYTVYCLTLVVSIYSPNYQRVSLVVCCVKLIIFVVLRTSEARLQAGSLPVLPADECKVSCCLGGLQVRCSFPLPHHILETAVSCGGEAKTKCLKCSCAFDVHFIIAKSWYFYNSACVCFAGN